MLKQQRVAKTTRCWSTSRGRTGVRVVGGVTPSNILQKQKSQTEHAYIPAKTKRPSGAYRRGVSEADFRPLPLQGNLSERK